MNDNGNRLADQTTTVARRASDAREAIGAAERAVELRNEAVRSAVAAGVSVSTVVEVTGLTRADVYRIIDGADQ